MKINKKLILVLLITFLQHTAYSWVATLRVMQHPDGHIVRLAGDIHLEGFPGTSDLEVAISYEEFFLKNIEEPLAEFLAKSSKEYEYFIVEKIAYDLLPNCDLFQNIWANYNMAALPLITRMNILGHPLINSSVKSMIAHIDEHKLEPKIEIIPYDIRSNYLELCTSFPTTQDEVPFFLNALIVNKEFFERDIQEIINNNREPDKCLSSLVRNTGQKLIKELHCNSNLDNFFSYTFADFGYLSFIAQHATKNATLYLGVTHCHNLAQYLEKAGYETIYEKGYYDENILYQNTIPCPHTKVEYRDFFELNRKL